MTIEGSFDPTPVPRRGLQRRRTVARSKAPVWFVLGCVVQGAAAALVALIALLAAARFYSFWTSKGIDDAPVWNWTSGAVTALTAAILLLTVGYLVIHGLLGISKSILRSLEAKTVKRGDSPQIDQLINIVEALCIGSGWSMPALAVINDEAPNALSVRGWRDRTLVVTSGLLATLSRDEIEAVCAHELSHLHAADARWVDAATYSLIRTKAFAGLLMTLGAGIAYLGFRLELFATGVIGALLTIVGFGCLSLVGRVLPQLRAQSDALADVAAILLSRNPESLGTACARLASDSRRVKQAPLRLSYAWFKLTGLDPTPKKNSREFRSFARTVQTDAAKELTDRAAHAYAEAGVAVRQPRPR